MFLNAVLKIIITSIPFSIKLEMLGDCPPSDFMIGRILYHCKSFVFDIAIYCSYAGSSKADGTAQHRERISYDKQQTVTLITAAGCHACVED